MKSVRISSLLRSVGVVFLFAAACWGGTVEAQAGATQAKQEGEAQQNTAEQERAARAKAAAAAAKAKTDAAKAKAAPQKAELKYQVPKGKKFTIITQRKEQRVREAMGARSVTQSEDVVDRMFEVKSMTSAGMSLETSIIKRMHVTDDPKAQKEPAFSGLAGKKTTFTLKPTGETAAFEGFDALPVIELPDDYAPLGKERYINEIRTLFPVFPAGPVGPGASWDQTLEMDEPAGNGAAKVVFDITYTVLEDAPAECPDCVKVGTKYNVSVKRDAEAQGQKITVDLKGVGSGTIYFQRKKGMFRNSETDLVLKGTIESEDKTINLPFEREYHSTAWTTWLQ
jgi:hypothetical protein